MDKKVKFVLNRSGVRSLLRGAEMMEIIDAKAGRVAQRAGIGYVTSKYTGRNRVNVSVYAETDEAWRDCLENNSLIKALGGGG